MGLDYVDIFYSHRFDPDTPLEETMGALDAAVRQGKALYVGISSYSGERTREAAAILRGLGTPLLIHQPSYSMLNRWIEADLLDALAEERIGCDRVLAPRAGPAHRPLPRRHPAGLSCGARGIVQHGPSDRCEHRQRPGLNEDRPATRPDSLLRWPLPGPSAIRASHRLLVGASSVEQLEDSLGALENLTFEPAELAETHRFAVEGGVNLWAPSSNA